MTLEAFFIILSNSKLPNSTRLKPSFSNLSQSKLLFLMQKLFLAQDDFA